MNGGERKADLLGAQEPGACLIPCHPRSTPSELCGFPILAKGTLRFGNLCQAEHQVAEPGVHTRSSRQRGPLWLPTSLHLAMPGEHREWTGFPPRSFTVVLGDKEPGLLLAHRFLSDTFNLFILSLPMAVCLGHLETICQALPAQLLERRKEPP